MSFPLTTKIRATLVGALLFTLAGCATKPVEVPVDDSAPGVRESLQQAMARADDAKARMETAAVPATLAGKSLTVIWEGDASEILKRIAMSQNLKFKQTGPMPRLPLPVFIKLRGATLSEALQVIGEQCGARADVVLTDSTIELRAKLY